jgi:tetratricopeptide (TPR) repeat protein
MGLRILLIRSNLKNVFWLIRRRRTSLCVGSSFQLLGILEYACQRSRQRTGRLSLVPAFLSRRVLAGDFNQNPIFNMASGFKWVVATGILGLSMILSGCAPGVIKPSQGVYQEAPRETDVPGENIEKQGLSPRALAALQLTDQGRVFLKNNQPDDAIGILERALNLNPNNGRNYYYLAEAWLMKWDIDQAEEFNRLAEIYLKDDSEWLNRVMMQRKRIKEHSQ